MSKINLERAGNCVNLQAFAFYGKACCNIFAKYGKSNKDTGSPESQVALFSYRIAHLTEHVKRNKKDNVTRRSLLRLVGKRRQILDYLQEIDIERYRNIVKELGLRR